MFASWILDLILFNIAYNIVKIFLFARNLKFSPTTIYQINGQVSSVCKMFIIKILFFRIRCQHNFNLTCEFIL